MKNEPIDLVVTYLDDSIPEWRASYNKYLKEEFDAGIVTKSNRQAWGEERIRNWDTMRYWFRGVEKNCPWIHKIFFIVQDKRHIPKWLNTQNPKLKIVLHEDYIPEQFLPTFNALIIQAFIPYIKDLSNNYIYSDDDNFFLNPIKETMFFQNNYSVHKSNLFWGQGTYTQFMGPWGHNLDNSYNIEVKYTKNKIRYAPYHLPTALNKKQVLKIIEDNKGEIYNSFKISRFRNPKNIAAIELYTNITKKMGNCIINNDIYKYCSYIGLTSTTNFNLICDRQIVCLNDTEKTEDFIMTKKKTIKFLQKKLPKQSSFELTKEEPIEEIEEEKDKKDDITLIIPCHQLEKWITPCLESLCSQINKHDIQRRAIFICDNCTDKTHEIIENKMKNSEWNYDIIDAHVGSPGLARNIGLDKANSNYIWFVDGDDWLTCDNAVDELWRLMAKDDMDIIEFKIKSKANPDGAFGGGTVWRCVLSSRIIGDMRFNNRQCGEDNDFIWDIYHKEGRKLGKIAMAPYFYNTPREGSQMWKKSQNLIK